MGSWSQNLVVLWMGIEVSVRRRRRRVVGACLMRGVDLRMLVWSRSSVKVAVGIRAYKLEKVMSVVVLAIEDAR